MVFIWADSLVLFFGEFFSVATSNSTINQKSKHKILGSLQSRLKITHSVKQLTVLRALPLPHWKVFDNFLTSF